MGAGEWLEVAGLVLLATVVLWSRMTLSEWIWWARRKRFWLVTLGLAGLFVALFGHFVWDWFR